MEEPLTRESSEDEAQTVFQGGDFLVKKSLRPKFSDAIEIVRAQGEQVLNFARVDFEHGKNHVVLEVLLFGLNRVEDKF